jgi:hypothetical protein
MGPPLADLDSITLFAGISLLLPGHPSRTVGSLARRVGFADSVADRVAADLGRKGRLTGGDGFFVARAGTSP